MEYEWDDNKAEENLFKHDIEFAHVFGVFEDGWSLSVEDDRFEDEQRFSVIGMDSFGRVLTVIYTYHGDRIRIISARKSTPRERQIYVESCKR